MFIELKNLLKSGVGKIYTAAASTIFYNDQILFNEVVGVPDLMTRSDITVDSSYLFDLASLTKIFTTTATLRILYSEGISIDLPVSSVLPEFLNGGANRGLLRKEMVTFRHLLTHSAGLPSWKAYFKNFRRQDLKKAVISEELIYMPGERILYSDLGFMILGWAIERITGESLRQVIFDEVILPLKLGNTGFGPFPCKRCVATEYCEWRRRRICGEVHDENAYALGGVAGHAGLFSTAFDVAKLGLTWLRGLLGLESFGIPRKIVKEAVSVQKQFRNTRRGLGWALWSPSSPARALGERTFGHTGFTGTSLYVDPDRRLVVSLLTNRVYYGRNPAPILLFRIKFHQLVKDIIKI